MNVFKRHKNPEAMTTEDALGDVMLDVRAARERRLGRIARQGGLMATFGIDAEYEVEQLRYDQNPPREVSYSALITRRLWSTLAVPHGTWRIMRQYPLAAEREPASFGEAMRKDAEECKRLFEQLPVGTTVSVAANIDHQLTVENADGTSEQLTWPREAHGFVFIENERPDKWTEFTVGGANFALKFNDAYEPVLYDDSKSVTLTRNGSLERGERAEFNYGIAFTLPKEFEGAIEVPKLGYDY